MVEWESVYRARHRVPAFARGRTLQCLQELNEPMPDHEMTAEGNAPGTGTRPESESNPMDSWLWTASWGAPRRCVLVGIWVVSGMMAFTAAGATAFVIFGILLWSGIAMGVVHRLESNYTPAIVLFLVCAAIGGIIAGIYAMRPAIKATRLYVSPPQRDDEDEEDGPFGECAEPDEPSRMV